MTIHLPEELEQFIRNEVLAGRYASETALVTEAIRLLKGKYPESSNPQPSPTGSSSFQPRKPIWEIAAELSDAIPTHEIATLPSDGAAEHDHYIYGTAKRSTS